MWWELFVHGRQITSTSPVISNKSNPLVFTTQTFPCNPLHVITCLTSQRPFSQSLLREQVPLSPSFPASRSSPVVLTLLFSFHCLYYHRWSSPASFSIYFHGWIVRMGWTRGKVRLLAAEYWERPKTSRVSREELYIFALLYILIIINPKFSLNCYNWSFQVHKGAEDKYLTPILLLNLPGKALARNLMQGLTSAALQGNQKKEQPLLSSKQGVEISKKCRNEPCGFQKKMLEPFSHTLVFLQCRPNLSCLVLTTNATHFLYPIPHIFQATISVPLGKPPLKGFIWATTVEVVANN